MFGQVVASLGAGPRGRPFFGVLRASDDRRPFRIPCDGLSGTELGTFTCASDYTKSFIHRLGRAPL